MPKIQIYLYRQNTILAVQYNIVGLIQETQIILAPD